MPTTRKSTPTIKPPAGKAAKTTAKAATTKKAAPARAARKATPTKAAPPPPADDDDDLLAEMEQPAVDSTEDDDEYDLLDEIGEGSSGIAWMPWDTTLDEPQPAGVQGTVTDIGEVMKDAKYVRKGDDPMAPMVTFESKDGTVWSVRGYATAVASQLNRCINKGMKTGDLFAIKYLGEKVPQGKGMGFASIAEAEEAGYENTYHDVVAKFKAR